MFVWPKPLSHVHRLGLLSQEISCHFPDHRGFTPKRFDCRTLHHFFAPVNVQEHKMGRLDVHRFMPRIRRYSLAGKFYTSLDSPNT